MNTTQTSPLTRRLADLAGRWRTDGYVVGDPPMPVTGTDVYELLDGGHFLVHHVDVTVGGAPVRAIEIIGELDAGADRMIARAYDNAGDATIMHVSVDDAGVWRFEGGSDVAKAAQPGSGVDTDAVRSTLTVAPDRRSMHALWERAGEDSSWQEWMHVDFRRED